MRIDRLVLGAVCVGASLSAQYRRRFNWQDYCFNHPAAPFCQGRDYAVKNSRAGKKGANTAVLSRPGIAIGGLDWRFADPAADTLVGINFGALSASPLARTLIARLGAARGLSDGDIQKMFDRLSGVSQLAISIRNGSVVVIATGRVSDLTVPSSEAGWKTDTVSKSAMLVGDPEAVDQAARRIAANTPPVEWERLAGERQAENEFWVMGSAEGAGPEAVSAGLNRFFVTVSIQDSVSSEAAFEFKGTPNAEAVGQRRAGAVEVEGNTVHVRMSVDDLAAGSRGKSLSALVSMAGKLPARDLTPPTGTKPVIYGLEGGPREVK